MIHDLPNILYITYDGLTDPLGQSQILPYLSGIKKKVGKIHILSSEKPERFKEYRKKLEDYCQHNNLTWHPTKYSKNPPFLSTFSDVQTLIREAKSICEKHQIQMIHCRSYVAGYVGYKLNKKLSIPFLFDIRGFWADERVDGGLWKLSNPFIKVVYKKVKSLEARMLKSASHVVSLTKEGKNEILTWPLGLREKNISVIPCCVDEKLFDKSQVEQENLDKLRKELKIDPDSFVLGYSGSIGTWYMLDEMLMFFQHCNNLNPKSVFLILTSEDPNLILTAAESMGIASENIIIKSCVRSEMPAHLSLMNAAIFFIKPLYSKKASSPTKFAEFMSMGIPVICNEGIGDMKSYFENYNPGIILQAMEDSSLQNAASTVPKLFEIDPKELRLIAQKEFSLATGINTYLEIYNNLISGGISHSSE